MIRKDEIENRAFDESIELKDNAMLRRRPELFHQWDFEKNDELGLDLYKVTQGSGKSAWWNCPKCKSSYDMEIYTRTGKLKSNCPYCRGLRVNYTNSLASLNPELASEWHPTLNGSLTPHDVTCGKKQKVWWICKMNHTYSADISNRSNNNGCPYCSNQKVLIGFNDMWCTNPELANLLADSEDGYKYTQSSGAYVDWKCLSCENIIKNKNIRDINKKGLSCPRCSDGIKFPEKFMYNLLKEAGIDFLYGGAFEWSQRKLYDFYLPEYNWIIETHGKQHYGVGFSEFECGKTLEEEQENDRLKEHLAKENSVNNYITIDSRNSTVEHMKNSILNSDIMKIAPEIDFIEIGRLASSSFVKIACEMWNSGTRSTAEISEIMSIDSQTILKYLKRGVEIGWCDYSACRRKEIVQLDLNSSILRTWGSVGEASLRMGIPTTNISKVCKGKRKTAGGCKWMYKEDYDEYIANQSKKEIS